jgi:LysM repeat protein
MSPLRFIVPLLCVLLAGCRLGSSSQGDEQKDPYFLAGKKSLQDRDYQGAIELFEKALDVNPRSASAHFELGVLYEQQQVDYSASLYHYGRAVMLNSNAPFAELSRQRMQECKRELTKSVVQPHSMQILQADLDALRAENQQLKQQLQAAQSNQTSRSIMPSNATAVPSPARTGAVTTALARNDLPPAITRSNPIARSNTTISGRTHTIASGDTPAGIARRYNVKLSALQSANPTMDARHLRVGQTLKIPPP